MSFSLDGYRSMLTTALDAGYWIRPFQDVPGRYAPAMILRHDLDYSLSAAIPMARLEAELGVRATYLVLPSSELYNAASADGRAAIREIRDLGHEVGLHYDTRLYDVADSLASFRAERAYLESIVGTPICSAAQHLPTLSGTLKVADEVAFDAYAPEFMGGEFEYISDSLMAWRQETPWGAVARRASVQLLIHPLYWVAEGEDLWSVMDSLERGSSGEARATVDLLRAQYRRQLAEREASDQRFRADRRLA